MPTVPFAQAERDVWRPIWNNEYTSKKLYSYIYDLTQAYRIFKMIWKSNWSLRIKFFTWHVMMDRPNTKTMLTRRHIGACDDDFCVMCDTGAEQNIEHLLFSCPFTPRCSNTLNFNWDHSLTMAWEGPCKA